MWKIVDEIIASPGAAGGVFLAGWLVCGSIAALVVRRVRYVRAIRLISFASAVAGAAIAGWFGWARYRLWHSEEWTDPPQGFPYPDALLSRWVETLRVPPPPGYLDLHSGLYRVDFRLFAIIAVSWFIVGGLAGVAISPQSIFRSVSRLLRPSTASESQQRPDSS